MQKLKDLSLKIKEDKKLLFGVVGILVFGVMFILFFPSNKQQPQKQPPQNQFSFGKTPGGQEVYKDLIQRFSADLERLSEVTQKTQQELQEQKQALAEHQERTREIFTKLAEKFSQQQAQPVSMDNQVQQHLVSSASEPEKFDMETFVTEQENLVIPPPPAPRRSAIINAGDAVKVELLSGVNAPVDGSPYPVVFKVVGDVYGPNNTTLPVGEARILAAAQGSLVDQRALFRLVSMTLSLPDGSRREVKVDGWVVGEDGIRGLPGILIDPLSEQLLGVGIAEGVRGFGRGIEASKKRVETDRFLGLTFEEWRGSAAELGAARALQGVAGVYADIIRQRANLLVPVVQVYSGRRATAVFSKSVELGEDLVKFHEDELEAGFSGIFE